MKLKRLARAAFAATAATAAIVGAVAVPASAAPVNAAVNGCIVEVTLVKAWNLQEPPTDKIYLKIAGQKTRTLPFVEFQQRLGAEFGDVTEFVGLGSSLKIAVFEADFPSADEHLGTISVPCNGVAFSDSAHVTNFGSDYEVSYRVTVVP